MTKIPSDQFPRIPLALFNKQINLTMARLFKSHECDLTREQEVILRELSVADDVNQVDLALRTGQDRNNLSRTLTLLEKKGFVERNVNDSDKRNSRVFITPEGRAMTGEAAKVIDSYRRILFKNFSLEEVNHFAATILRLIDNLSEFVNQESEDAPPRQVRKGISRAKKAPGGSLRSTKNL